MIHPLCNFRMNWDFLIILLIFYTLLVVPFRVAYYWGAVARKQDSFQDWDTAVDFIFIFDLVLNFNTGLIRLRDQVR